MPELLHHQRISWRPIFAVLLLWAGTAAFAQLPLFDSGSDGSDGALDLTGLASGGGIVFDPAGFDPPLDTDGDNVYHFTTINIPMGVTVKMSGPVLNMRPVYWLASGEVTIDGVIDLDGEDGALVNTHRLSMPGPGGYPSGAPKVTVEGVGEIAMQQALGPGAGKVDRGTGGAGNAVFGEGVNYGFGVLIIRG